MLRLHFIIPLPNPLTNILISPPHALHPPTHPPSPLVSLQGVKTIEKGVGEGGGRGGAGVAVTSCRTGCIFMQVRSSKPVPGANRQTAHGAYYLLHTTLHYLLHHHTHTALHYHTHKYTCIQLLNVHPRVFFIK